MQRYLALAAFALAAPLLFSSPAALAGANCNQKTSQIDGVFGGEPFGFPARLNLGEGDNVGISAEDCDRFDDARKKADQAAANAAALDVFGLEPGLNLTANYAQSNFNEDGHAIGLNLSYKLPEGFAGDDAWVQGAAFTFGGATGTNWDDQLLKVGGTISFGQLF